MSRTITITGSLSELIGAAGKSGLDCHTFGTEHEVIMGAVLRYDGRDVGGIQRDPVSSFGAAVVSVNLDWCPLDMALALLKHLGR